MPVTAPAASKAPSTVTVPAESSRSRLRAGPTRGVTPMFRNASTEPDPSSTSTRQNPVSPAPPG